MKKQVLLVHGGDSFNTYEDYIEFLNGFKIDSLDYFKGINWKNNLQTDLGKNFEVICPQMPNKMNARYKEWKIWFEKIIPFLEDGIILIGHSLGGTFLAKYLSENNLPVKISGLHLVAAVFDDESDEPLMDFSLGSSLENISKQVLKIFLYYSKDDKIVPFGELEKYKSSIPSARSFVFEDMGHFNQEKFPEIIKEILNC